MFVTITFFLLYLESSIKILDGRSFELKQTVSLFGFFIVIKALQKRRKNVRRTKMDGQIKEANINK